MRRRLERREFFWLDMESPSPEELAEIGELLGLHPLALEDAQKFDQRPKIDEYDDLVVLVVFGAAADPSLRGGIAPVEVHCFYAARFLVTVHKGQCAVFAELREQHERRLRRAEEGLSILYLVLDALVDSFFPRLADLDDEIDELEDEIFLRTRPEQLQEAMTMKRQLVTLRKVVHPQRDMFGALLNGRYELPGMTTEYERYFRDVYDHLIRVAEQLDDYRDLTAGSMELYQSTTGNNMNVTMKQLGWVATFFLPLSFITGFFGQNFAWLVDRLVPGWVFFAFGLGLDTAAFLAVLAWYLSRERAAS